MGKIADPTTPKPPPARPRTKPPGDWPMLVAAYLIKIAVNEPHRLHGDISDLVEAAQIFLESEIGWMPEERALRDKIVELLRLVKSAQ